MARVHNRDGSITFLADDGSGATQTIAPGTPSAVWIPQYNTFAAAHPGPSLLVPPAALVILPTADPGFTGAAFYVNNTLMVSQGSVQALQIGATGPTGPIVGQIG